MPYVNSRAIEWVDYDPQTRRLNVRFCSGTTTYTFYGVPQHVYDALLSASSKGDFYHTHIKDKYAGP